MMKFNGGYKKLKTTATSVTNSLDFIHYWGPVYKIYIKDFGRTNNGIDKELVWSCWRSKSTTNILHNCVAHISDKTSTVDGGACFNCPRTYENNNWKLMRRPTVHINFPLFDIDKYIEISVILTRRLSQA